MNSNVAGCFSLNSGMSDYRRHVSHNTKHQSDQNDHDLNRERPSIYTDIQEGHQDFTNRVASPFSSPTFHNQTYAFEDHENISVKAEAAIDHSINFQHLPQSHSDYSHIRQQPFTVEASQAMPGNYHLPFMNSYENHGDPSGFHGLNRHTPSHLQTALTMTRQRGLLDVRVWSCQPYARLIYEALKQAPGHRMVLKDIYEWFERYTDKPQTSNHSGWKNSIRHNLSMNAAFEKIEARSDADDGKKTYIWALSVHALAVNGVESTTRYRKLAAKKSTLPNPRNCISKKTKSQPSVRRPRIKTELSQVSFSNSNMVSIKQEGSTQDLAAQPRDISEVWTSQTQDNVYPALMPATVFRGEDRKILDDYTDGYHLTCCSRRSNLPSPHMSYGNHDFQASVQHMNPDSGFHHSESPTPSMTTSHSPFAYQDDYHDLQPQYPVHYQAINILQDDQSGKHSDHIYSAVYQTELANFRHDGCH